MKTRHAFRAALFILAAATLALAAPATRAHANSVTYDYTGYELTTGSGPFLGDIITATVTFASVPTGSTPTTVTTATAWSISAGGTTIASGTSGVYVDELSFTFTSGAITEWELEVYNSASPYTTLTTAYYGYGSGGDSAQDSHGYNSTSTSYPYTPSNWTLQGSGGDSTTPEPCSLLLVGSSLGLAGLNVLRRKFRAA